MSTSELLLLRHGTAVDHAPHRDDHSRELVEKGERQATAAGRALVALDLVPDVVLASPKARAWRTAMLAAEAFAGEPLEHRAVVGLDQEEALLASRLAPRVLVVGHEPDLSQVVHDLTGARIRMRKGGLAVIAVDGSRGELRALLGPRELARIGA